MISSTHCVAYCSVNDGLTVGLDSLTLAAEVNFESTKPTWKIMITATALVLMQIVVYSKEIVITAKKILQ